MNKFMLLLTGILMLSGCQLTDAPMWLQASDHQAVSEPNLLSTSQTQLPVTPNQPATVSALYQHPSVDAEIAAAVKDFRLLGYQADSASYITPAVPNYYTQAHIKQGCGIRLIPGAANASVASFGDKQRQSIRQYIEQYNRLMLSFCENHVGKNLRVAYRQSKKR